MNTELEQEETLASALWERGPAQVIMKAVLAIQVCVPADWTDEQIVAFGVDYELAKGGRNNPAFSIRRGKRAPCSQRAGCVHVVLEA